MIGAIIFDLDGVLADTEHLHYLAFADAFNARGWTLTQAAYIERYLGLDDRGVVTAYANDNGTPLATDDTDALVSTKAVAFGRLIATTDVLFPDAAACVSRRLRRYRLGVASGALHSEIVTILTAGGVLHAFSALVGADDVREPKPSPAAYLEAAARLGVVPSDCVAVEDSRWGLAAAKAAGMRALALPTTSPAAMLASADLVLSTLADLTPALLDRF